MQRRHKGEGDKRTKHRATITRPHTPILVVGPASHRLIRYTITSLGPNPRRRTRVASPYLPIPYPPSLNGPKANLISIFQPNFSAHEIENVKGSALRQKREFLIYVNALHGAERDNHTIPYQRKGRQFF